MAGVAKTYETESCRRARAGRRGLDIREGEFVCVVGPSGCGKSTLLRILAGLDGLRGGRALPGRRDHHRAVADVGVVFQAANLLPWLTVRENVRLPLRVGGRRSRPTPSDIDALLAMAGLDGFGARYPYQLSGGMQQRAGHLPRAGAGPEHAADGRAVRRARRADARAHERRAAAHLAGQPQDGDADHAQHLGGDLPGRPRRRDVGAPRPRAFGGAGGYPIPRPRSFDTIVQPRGLSRRWRARSAAC